MIGLHSQSGPTTGYIGIVGQCELDTPINFEFFSEIIQPLSPCLIMLI